jgi:hypothetical protein
LPPIQRSNDQITIDGAKFTSQLIRHAGEYILSKKKCFTVTIPT